MDKVKLAKCIGKTVVGLGTSMMLGGLGGLAAATFKVGIQQTVAKVCIPMAASVWSSVLRKHSDTVVEETIDSLAKVVNEGFELGKNLAIATES